MRFRLWDTAVSSACSGLMPAARATISRASICRRRRVWSGVTGLTWGHVQGQLFRTETECVGWGGSNTTNMESGRNQQANLSDGAKPREPSLRVKHRQEVRTLGDHTHQTIRQRMEVTGLFEGWMRTWAAGERWTAQRRKEEEWSKVNQLALIGSDPQELKRILDHVRKKD